MSDGIYSRFGDFELPATAASVAETGTLSDLDPVRRRMLSLFESAIRAELQEAWAAVIDTTDSKFPLTNARVIEDTLELEPTAWVMTQRKAQFPLLCLHRSGEAIHEEHTLELDRVMQEWSLHYIVGAIDAAHAHKVLDICTAVWKTVRQVIKARGHKSFESGALQFFPGTGGLASIRMKSHVGPAQAVFGGDKDGTVYWAVTMELETFEICSDTEGGAETLEGASYDVGVGSDDGVLPSIVLGDTDTLPPNP